MIANYIIQELIEAITRDLEGEHHDVKLPCGLYLHYNIHYDQETEWEDSFDRDEPPTGRSEYTFDIDFIFLTIKPGEDRESDIDLNKYYTEIKTSLESYYSNL
jgi:hypothetical protein